MKWWTRIFPVAFVAYYARKNMQRIPVGERTYVKPFDDVLIEVTE